MAQASILSEYAAEDAIERARVVRAAAPIKFWGIAMGVFAGNLLTGAVAAAVYFALR